jgi:hypothetical protein
MNTLAAGAQKVKEGFIDQRMFVLSPNIKKIAAKNGLPSGLYFTYMGSYPHAVFHDRGRKSRCS